LQNVEFCIKLVRSNLKFFGTEIALGQKSYHKNKANFMPEKLEFST